MWHMYVHINLYACMWCVLQLCVLDVIVCACVRGWHQMSSLVLLWVFVSVCSVCLLCFCLFIFIFFGRLTELEACQQVRLSRIYTSGILSLFSQHWHYKREHLCLDSHGIAGKANSSLCCFMTSTLLSISSAPIESLKQWSWKEGIKNYMYACSGVCMYVYVCMFI